MSKWPVSVFAILALCSCGPMFPCVDEVIAEVASPDGNTIAVIFERDCGATTAKNTQISLRQKSEKFSPKKHPSFLVSETDEKIAVHWRNNTNLIVHLPRSIKIFRNETARGSISITYE